MSTSSFAMVARCAERQGSPLFAGSATLRELEAMIQAHGAFHAHADILWPAQVGPGWGRINWAMTIKEAT